MIISIICAVICLFLLPWMLVNPWFFAISHIEAMGYRANSFKDIFRLYRSLNKDLGWQVAIPMIIFLPAGALFGDVLYNATWGSVIFREWPRELFFTERVKRKIKEGHPRAASWKARINKIQPGHI